MILGTVVFFLSLPLVGVSAAEPAGAYAPGELLVKFKSTAQPRGKANTRAAKHVHLKAQFPSLGVEQWVLPADVSLSETLDQLRADPTVEFAEPNYRRYPRKLPNESKLTSGNVLARLQQMHVPEAWDTVTDASSVIVAVIDDGFDMAHPDLKDNYYLPRDVKDKDNDPSPGTCNNAGYVTGKDEHGTEVAGVLGARGDNNIGISGVTWKLKLMPIRVGCDYYTADTIQALKYAQDNRANIINISWGGPDFSVTESAAFNTVLQSNILVVTAAGNFDVDNDKVPDFPSGLPYPNILVVASVDENNVPAKWTQYGATTVDVVAPGTAIWTTLVGGQYSTTANLALGTSFSAPYVAGVAALLKAKKGNATYRDLKGAIMSSVDPVVAASGAQAIAATGRLATDGTVNAKAALDGVGSPVPVLVINKLVVEVSAGNKNGLAEPGETVKLNVSIENVWAAATGVSAALAIDPAAPDSVNDATVRTDPSVIGSIAEGEIVTKSFSVLISKSLQGRNVIPFTLTLTAGQLTQKRHFKLNIGLLIKSQPASGIVRPRLDPQDEFHYYHIDVPANSIDLVFELVPDKQPNLDMLVRYGKLPEFDYALYAATDPDTGKQLGDGLSDGTFMQFPPAPAGVSERVSIKNPKVGTYYVVVLPNNKDNQENMRYTLSATYGHKVPSSGGGCVLVADERFDPVLPLLVMIAAFGVVGSRLRQQKGN